MPPKKKKDKLPAITQLPSGAYRTQIYLGKDPATGKKIVESFSDPDYQTVVRWAMDRMRDREQSAELRKTPGKMTLGEAIDAYIAVKSSVLSPSTIKNYKAFRRTGMQHLMDVPLQRITQSDLQAAINVEAATLAAKTVRNHYGVITATMAMYVPNIRMNITLPQRQKPDICIPAEKDIKLILNAAKDTPMDAPLHLAACCGMRRGEICALKWSDINFKKNTLTIRSAVVYDENEQLVEKAPKTKAGKRTVYMLPVVADSLKRTKATQEAEGEKSSNVVPLTPAAMINRFIRLQTKLDIPKFRFHDLRHYTVSVMLLLNIPKKYIADYVGHETENMIDQVYGHIMQEKKASFTDQLQDYFSKNL
jgi:integrase